MPDNPLKPDEKPPWYRQRNKIIAVFKFIQNIRVENE